MRSGPRAHSDLPALVKSMQPKVGELAIWALAAVAGIGGGILQFLAAFVVAGVIMAFGEGGARSSEAIFARIVSPERAPKFVALSTATIRAVAQGVIGVALIQALAVGVILLVAGIPLAGLLAIIVLVHLLGRDDLDVVEPLVRVEAALHRLLAHLRDVAGARVVAREGEQRAVLLVELRVLEVPGHQLVHVLGAGVDVRLGLP